LEPVDGCNDHVRERNTSKEGETIRRKREEKHRFSTSECEEDRRRRGCMNEGKKLDE
jgi:hypothetical protein